MEILQSFGDDNHSPYYSTANIWWIAHLGIHCDIDGRVLIISSGYYTNTFKLPVETACQPWHSSNEFWQVGGSEVGYKEEILARIRGAGTQF
ncbi:Carboxypeptidase [Quillaja saponaria]|uniref:Carboxypeptidase n=1 Tax=Quillaja saponaria TaxID=32244 RepID=A0AAD7LIU1_QUISA|nr:Carboxypeptidase [Quillaja saponaria]